MTYVASVIFAAPDYTVSDQVVGIGLAYFDLASQSDFVYYFDLSSASGGGVGQTYTMRNAVQPLAETFSGPDGYSATAQSNAAAQNSGARGRALHAANGLHMADSL